MKFNVVMKAEIWFEYFIGYYASPLLLATPVHYGSKSPQPKKAFIFWGRQDSQFMTLGGSATHADANVTNAVPSSLPASCLPQSLTFGQEEEWLNSMRSCLI